MFKRILICNRGEIALRIIRACREMGIETVAAYSQADEGSLPAQLATQAVCIGPAKAADSYLNACALLTAAQLTCCQAIHPGYGFLSENAEFSDLCRDCGIQFIGPSGHVIRQMGNKPPPESWFPRKVCRWFPALPDRWPMQRKPVRRQKRPATRCSSKPAPEGAAGECAV